MFSIREIYYVLLSVVVWPDVVWLQMPFACAPYGLHSVLLADYVVRFFSQHAQKFSFFLGECTWSGCERVHLSASGVRWMSCLYNVGLKKGFPPQSFSSGHTKGLPIGIILSFVLLTSMKLPSLVCFFFFFFSFCFYFFMLYVVTIWGVWLT